MTGTFDKEFIRTKNFTRYIEAIAKKGNATIAESNLNGSLKSGSGIKLIKSFITNPNIAIIKTITTCCPLLILAKLNT